MPSDTRMERIRQLTSQLGRAESPEVIACVAAQLQVAIAEYVQETEQRFDALDLALLRSPA